MKLISFRLMRLIPEGKCSLIDQLSTCNVAFPPFLVKRTTWYFPSFTGVLLSCTLISTVPMLNVTPILPCCWNDKNSKYYTTFNFLLKYLHHFIRDTVTVLKMLLLVVVVLISIIYSIYYIFILPKLLLSLLELTQLQQLILYPTY